MNLKHGYVSLPSQALSSSSIRAQRPLASCRSKMTKGARAPQARALKEGIPYQTLVSSVLHQYVDGQLIDKSANKAN
ncbi:MAG: hypothetical protein ACU83N_14425 [Gammaproteobacteria bacterium]